MPRVSIVIPIYNGEGEIEQCLNFVLEQSFADFEVICVDDGSTDRTSELLARLEKEDSRIRLLRTEHRGTARARKHGGQRAEGKYLTFVDADDQMDPDFLEELMNVPADYDLVTSGYRTENGECYDTIAPGSYCSAEELRFVLSNLLFYEGSIKRGITPYIWGKRYRTEIAREVFDEICEDLTYAEDTEFLCRYLLKCQSIQVTRICGYHYRQCADSVVHRPHRRFLRCMSDFYDSLEPVFSAHPYREALLSQLELWVLDMTSEIALAMGFSPEARKIRYYYTGIDGLVGKSIVLYGAGAVGKSYYMLLKRDGNCRVVLWIDQREVTDPLGKIRPVNALRGVDFDFVLIAIAKKEIADEVREELHAKYLIPYEKMLWEKPFYFHW